MGLMAEIHTFQAVLLTPEDSQRSQGKILAPELSQRSLTSTDSCASTESHDGNDLASRVKHDSSTLSSRDEFDRWAYLLKHDSLPTSCDDYEGLLQQLRWDSLDEPGFAVLAAQLNDSQDCPVRKASGFSQTRSEDWALLVSTRTPPSYSFASNATGRSSYLFASLTGQVPTHRSGSLRNLGSPRRRRKRDVVKAWIGRAFPCILPAHEQDVDW